jgi:hypothetical protein
MKSNACAALLLLALAAPAAEADARFTGHWTEKSAPKHCTVVRGFDLRADGVAMVDWATDGGIERRAGSWNAHGGKLHLAVIETVSDPAPLRVETDIDGTLNASRELETTVTNTRDHNIDGAPYSARCTYIRR